MQAGEGYGALWWLNRGGRYPHVPRDCYSCEGYEGQYIWVIPVEGPGGGAAGVGGWEGNGCG